MLHGLEDDVIIRTFWRYATACLLKSHHKLLKRADYYHGNISAIAGTRNKRAKNCKRAASACSAVTIIVFFKALAFL